MPDRDSRNPTTGETAQETADRLAGNGGPSKAEGGGKQVDGGAKGPMVPQRPAPQNIHPSAKGVYGSPIDSQLVK
jgi:hypothetical protein